MLTEKLKQAYRLGIKEYVVNDKLYRLNVGLIELLENTKMPNTRKRLVNKSILINEKYDDLNLLEKACCIFGYYRAFIFYN